MGPGVQDQPGQHGETLSLLNIQKLVGHGGQGRASDAPRSSGLGPMVSWSLKATQGQLLGGPVPVLGTAKL